MAKKIIISFSDQPVTTGVGFSYSIEINSFLLYYANGTTDCKIDFIPNGDTPSEAWELPIGNNLEETLQITLSFLRENYINQYVSYNIVNQTIEVLINQEAIITIDASINDNIEISTQDVEPSETNLKYYLYLDDYILNIYKSNYTGNSSEIFGDFYIKKSPVDNILTPIRGTGLYMSLEADKTLTFDEFLLADEFTYKVELIKGNQTIFKGYIKPDGVQQNFVNDIWLVNIESTDGLGALKDLSFVQATGLQFTGKLSLYDVIKGCLDRTKLSLDINTSVYIEYDGYVGNNILKDVYVNSSRFIKDSSDDVIMDCNEVLTSVLNLFSGVITQQNGQWWIYRPNDLVLNGYTDFINQTTETGFTKNLNVNLGSQINGFYPHHSGANQQIEVKGAISAYRLNYQYGFLDGFLPNPNLNHDEFMVYEDWTTNPSLPTANIEIIQDALSLSGLRMIIKEGSPQIDVLTSSPISISANSELLLKAKVSTIKTNGLIEFATAVQFILKIIRSDGYWLNGANQWVTSDQFIRINTVAVTNVEKTLTYELLIPIVPADCDITIKICEVRLSQPSSQITASVNYIQLLDNELKKSGIVGEFHTVSRKNPPSSITKENQKVFNGDGSILLVGSLYKSDQETLTSLWSRKNKFEKLPLLGISAMDDLRIQSNPIKLFSGDVYGEIPYMSVVKIDNVSGQFMPIEYEFYYKTNILQLKLLEFYNSDLGDIEYSISPDYGNSTIKPTIKG